MKHIIFFEEKNAQLRYLVFDGIIQKAPRVDENNLVVKVDKFKLFTQKNTSYTKKSGWIVVPRKKDDNSGGLIHITDEENPEEAIKEAIKQKEDVMPILALAALFGII